MNQTAEKKTQDKLPHSVLAAVATCQSRITLVIGAGCSIDPPTNLPSGRDLARCAYSALVANGLIAETDAIDRDDLTSVADAAFAATKSNDALVEVLDPIRFANANPNYGHLIAAALLIEGSIRDVLTINYDLAMSSALIQLGAGDKVGSILGQEHHGRQIARNVIYVNGSAYATPDKWVLTTQQLDDAWQGAWEQLVSERATASPVIIFVGLSASAKVLSEAAKRVKSMVPHGVQICFVNPAPFESCTLAKEMNLNAESYVQKNWIELAEALAARLLSEQILRLNEKLPLLISEQHRLDEVLEQLAPLFGRLNLLLLGKLRSEWLFHPEQYRPAIDTETSLLAVLLYGLAIIKRNLNADALVENDGRVRLVIPGNAEILVLLGSGKGFRRFQAVESQLRERSRRAVCATSTLVLGLIGSTLDNDSGPGVIPGDLIEDDDPNSIASASLRFHSFGCSALMDNPAILEKVVG